MFECSCLVVLRHLLTIVSPTTLRILRNCSLAHCFLEFRLGNDGNVTGMQLHLWEHLTQGAAPEGKEMGSSFGVRRYTKALEATFKIRSFSQALSQGEEHSVNHYSLSAWPKHGCGLEECFLFCLVCIWVGTGSANLMTPATSLQSWVVSLEQKLSNLSVQTSSKVCFISNLISWPL